MPAPHDDPSVDQRVVNCPRCGNDTPISLDKIRSDQFCKHFHFDHPCDYPLFFVDPAEVATGEGPGRPSRWRPDDPAPAPYPPPPVVAPVIVVQIPVKPDPVSTPPVPEKRRRQYWKLWPLVAVIAVVDIVLIVLIIFRYV